MEVRLLRFARNDGVFERDSTARAKRLASYHRAWIGAARLCVDRVCGLFSRPGTRRAHAGQAS